MTEAEAKTQDCIGPPNCGRQEDHTSSGCLPRRLCIGSACKMAWRWEEETYDEKPTGRYSRVQGYCGLAGKP
jgi:hypothetical protein